jgi:peptidyl-prolyl cis-trans isomerase C
MPRTTFLRSLVTALALLVLLASASVTAQGDDPVLIELGSQRELSSSVMARFEIAVRGLAAGQGMPYDDALMAQVYPFLPQFLEQRAAEMVLLDHARSRGVVVEDERIDEVVAEARAQFPDDDAFLEVLATAGFRDEDQLRAVARETETIDALIVLIEAETVLSELEVRMAYESLRSQLTEAAQVCARHILVAEEAQAAELSAAVREGADFAALAEEFSTDRGSAASGGELGCFPTGVMVAEFEEAVFGAAVGEVTEPVRSAFGYHVILVDERLPARVRPLADVREPLEQQIVSERVQAKIAGLVEFSGVRTYPERIPPLGDPEGDAD